VLIVITRGQAGGAQVHVRDLVQGLRDRIDFHVVVGDEGFLSQQLRALGAPVHIVPALQREIDPRADRAALGAIRKLVRSLRPHLVHTHSSKAGLLGRLAARLEGVPAIHTAHAWSFSDGLSWRRKALAVPIEALVGRLTRRFVVVSEADRDVGTRWHVAPDRSVRVVHNGVSDVPQRARPDRDGVPIAIMVARLAAPKDHLLLLHAMAGLDLPWRLRLVGDGPQRHRIEAAVAALGLADRVRLVGDSDAVPKLLASSHVAVLVSRQEGFPLVVLEAMRAGLPVIASNVGGVAEAVQDGVTGLLVPQGDEAALRVALGRLCGNPALRQSMGEAGRRAYEAHFTVGHMLAGTLDVYRELCRIEGWPMPAAWGVA